MNKPKPSNAANQKLYIYIYIVKLLAVNTGYTESIYLGIIISRKASDSRALIFV